MYGMEEVRSSILLSSTENPSSQACGEVRRFAEDGPDTLRDQLLLTSTCLRLGQPSIWPADERSSA